MNPRHFLAANAFAVISLPVFAQFQPLNIAEPTIRLELTSTDGTNGSAVAYHHTERAYYTVVAGNAMYPIDVFDLKGNPVCYLEAGTDLRGMWWNDTEGEVQANAYSFAGIYAVIPDGSGCISGTEFRKEDLFQPSDQTVEFYDSGKKRVCAYADGSIIFTKGKKMKQYGSIVLDIPTYKENINFTSAFYTNQSGFEYGIVDFVDPQIYLFNRQGQNTATVSLPQDAVVSDMFRVSYANNQLWLFNVDTRTWQGYRILE